MTELYEVWTDDGTGWMPVHRRCSLKQAERYANFWDGREHGTFIVPAPIMTAQAWVEIGEV